MLDLAPLILETLDRCPRRQSETSRNIHRIMSSLSNKLLQPLLHFLVLTRPVALSQCHEHHAKERQISSHRGGQHLER